MQEHDGAQDGGRKTVVATAGIGADEPAGEVLVRLLRAAREHLGMDVAFVSEFVDGERVFRHVDAGAPGPVRVGGSDPLDESYCQRVVDGRLPGLIRDARDHPAAVELSATATLPVGAHLSVPLVLSDGRVYGTFCCFGHAADHSLTERDLGVVRMFADVAREYLEADLERARERDLAHRRITSALTVEGRLRTVYQPVVDLRDGRVLGVEALSRFPERFGRPPDVWFAEATSVGLGPELEALAVRSASAVLPRLRDDVFLAVNVSPEAVMSGRLDDVLADLDPTRLVLEMTEHAPVVDYDELNAVLHPLRRRGLRVAVDDAGAGYASLRHILRLEPDWIKIDGSITRGLDADPARSALAAALVDFAAGTGSGIIAEGVETEAELRALRSVGATAGQGYHLGRPADLPDADEVGTGAVA